MSAIRYLVTRNGPSWSIDQDGDVAGDYATKEAAFEAAVGAASNAIKDGYGVTVSVPEPEAGESALGIKEEDPAKPEATQASFGRTPPGTPIRPQRTWRG